MNTAATLVAATTLAAATLYAQTPIPRTPTVDFNQHLWASYTGDHRVKDKWGFHMDGQWRRSDFGTEWQQYQLRPAVNYYVSDKLMLTLGYAWTQNYPYGDYPVRAPFTEHRMYQQVLWRTPVNGIRFSHRFRLEQRWIKYPPTTDIQTTTYQNRFRYMLRAELPIAGEPGKPGQWYVPVWDEILLGIEPNIGSRTYDHNRAFIGVGRTLPNSSAIEVGYMNQFLGQRNGRVWEFNNTFHVTFSSTFDFRKRR